MRLKEEENKVREVDLMLSKRKDLNLTISIHLSKEAVERLIVIFLTFILGLPISFLTALYVSKQAASLNPVNESSDYNIQNQQQN